MHIAVCIKQVIDPEIPARAFRVDREQKRVVAGSASMVIGPFDLNALEVAMQLKERSGAKVTAITIGGEPAREALKRALAMGADAAVLVEDVGRATDPASVARILAAAVRKLGDVQIVLCGRQDGDWDFGQVGGLLADQLQWAYVPFVPRLAVEGGTIRLEREVDGGRVVLETSGPVVASVTNASDNVARLPKVRDIMMAGRRPIASWSLAELGLADLGPARLELLDLFIPEVKRDCEYIEGESGAEKGVRLARRLAELKLL